MRTHAALCFVCARRFVHMSGTQKHPDIEYKTLLKRDLNESLSAECDYLLGCNMKYAKRIFSLESHCEVYGKVSDSVELSEVSEELDDWHLNVTLNDETFKILCCPEDVQCARLEGNEHRKNECCDQCVAPVCKECFVHLDSSKPKLPPPSLANDMMVFYPPKMLYEQKVTIMEMICASVCITSIICFTLEKKYRNVRGMDEAVHANEHRMAFRGNATSFPLPWEDLMVQLRDSQASSDAAREVSLPRVGGEFVNVVSILFFRRGRK